MKILLVNPICTKKDPKRFMIMFPVLPSLGLAYLGAVAEKEGHEVRILDAYNLSRLRNFDYKEFEKMLLDFSPDVVAFTGASSQLADIKKSVITAKKMLPNVTTIMGGPHITCSPQDLVADYGVYGEGEETFSVLINKIEKGEKIEDTPGVVWREKGKIKFKTRPFIKNLDDIPMPAWHLLPMKLYRPSLANYRRLPAFVLMTSRGCPFKCIFCHNPIFGGTFRGHSPERIVAEIKHLRKHYGIKDVEIFDDTFTLDRSRLVKTLKLMISEKVDLWWNCTTRVDQVDYELLKLMKKAGCYAIGYGIETGTPRLLKMTKKGETMDQMRQAIKWTKKVGLQTRLFFMLGFPTETKEELEDTLKFAKELNADIAQTSLVNPFPGTELWDLAKKHGTVRGDWKDFVAYNQDRAPFVPDTMSEKELLKFHRKMYRSFFFRPSILLREFLKIRSFSDIIGKIKGMIYILSQ